MSDGKFDPTGGDVSESDESECALVTDQKRSKTGRRVPISKPKVESSDSLGASKRQETLGAERTTSVSSCKGRNKSSVASSVQGMYAYIL